MKIRQFFKIFSLSLLNLWLNHSLANASERKLDLSWDAIKGAVSYELEVTGKLSSSTQNFAAANTETSIPLQPDIYEIKIRSIDKRRVPGEWGNTIVLRVDPLAPEWESPTQSSTIKYKSYDKGETAFKWKPQSGARFYRLKITSKTSDFSVNITTPNTSYKVELPIEETFVARVASLLEDHDSPNENSTVYSPALEFSTEGLKLRKPKIKKPEHEFIFEIGWDSVARAETYSYQLHRKDTKNEWVLVQQETATTKTEIPLPESYPGGTYRVTVQAKATKIRPSDEITHTFDLFMGSRNAESYEAFLRKQSLEKPTNYYFVASYLITSISYKGTNTETKQNAQFSALGGTGRLGIGYTPKAKSWGTYTIVDLSGFLIGDKNNTFPSIEVHGLWRKYLSSYQLRVTGGVFARTLPEIIGDTSAINSQSFEVKNISGLGPHIGFDVWKPITPKLGVQFNWHLYQAITKIETPNSLPLSPTSSHQIGLLGSYRYRPNIMAFGGYANRVDQLAYKTSTDEKNTVSISGHYLNFVLEVDF